MSKNDEWPLVDEETAKAAWGILFGKPIRGSDGWFRRRSPGYEDFKDCIQAYAAIQSFASSKPSVDDQS